MCLNRLPGKGRKSYCLRDSVDTEGGTSKTRYRVIVKGRGFSKHLELPSYRNESVNRVSDQ